METKQTVTLSNGVEMPMLGYGVYQVDPAECERCVADALSVGYRMVDTAQAYGNEQGVGNAVKRSGLSRGELFLVTKVWISNAGYERAKASIDESLRRLQTDYVDLLLIHQPFNDYYGTYRAMEEAYRAGKARVIGVSNFYPDRLVDLAEFNEIRPMVNQVETHVFNQQVRAREVMRRYGTQIMSWAPFAEGRNGFFTNPVLEAVGRAHGKSVAQTALRYLLQRGVVVIPKSVHRQRMEENFAPYPRHSETDNMRSASFVCKTVYGRILDSGYALDEPAFQFPHQCCLHLQILIDHLRRKTDACDPRYILRTRTDILLLFSAEHDRSYLHFTVNIEKSDSLRAVDLVSACRQKIDPHPLRPDAVFSISLHSIRVEKDRRLIGFHDLCRLLYRLDCPHLIVYIHD